MYAFEHLEIFDLVNNNIKKKRSVENPALITDWLWKYLDWNSMRTISIVSRKLAQIEV